ncbi:MAG: pRL2-11, partial [Gemmatimonadales bacterium]
LLVAQSATAAALGGPEVRECFAVRILSRYTRNAWNMLVPEVQPVPRSTRHVGRAQVVLGGVAHETQVAFFTNAEAREWAESGSVAAPIDGGYDVGQDVTSRRHVTPVTSEDDPSASRDVTPVRLTLVKGGPDAPAVPPMPSIPPQVKRYTLAEACREGIIPMKPDALRAAKKRDTEKGEFPPGDNGRWTAEELTRWFRNRPGTVASGE